MFSQLVQDDGLQSRPASPGQHGQHHQLSHDHVPLCLQPQHAPGQYLLAWWVRGVRPGSQDQIISLQSPLRP